MGSILCPNCGRQVATAAGAFQAQCFGCGTTISLQSMVTKPTKPTGLPGWFLGVAIGGGIIAVLAVLLVIGFVVAMPRQGATVAEKGPAQAIEPIEVPSSTVTNPANADPSETIVVTDEQRQRAERVPPEIRQQVIEMYDKMTSSTNRKVLAPKQSTPRTSVESLLNSIEQREITHMAALFQVDEADIEAVIQVELASR